MPDPVEDFGRSPLLPFGLGAASVGLLVYTLTWAGHEVPLGLVGSLAVLAILAEQLAPATGSFGFFPLAMPLYLGAAMLPEVGPHPVALYLMLALLLRTIARGGASSGRWMELVSDLFPAATALVCTGILPEHLPDEPLEWLRWLVPCLAFLATWVMETGLFSAAVSQESLRDWTLIREKGLPLITFLALSCPLMAVFARSQPVALPIFGALTLLLRTPLGLMVVAYRIEIEERSRREEDLRLSKTQKVVLQRQKEQELSGQELALQTEIMGLLGEMLATMSTHVQQGESSRRLLSALKNQVPCRTMALFVSTDHDHLSLSGCHSPAAREAPPRLEAASDQLIWQSWATQTFLGSQQSGLAPLVEGEQAMAIPIRDWGVLYVGDTHPTWQERHLDFLVRVAPHLRLFIDSARYYELQASALETETALRRQLESLLQGMTRVLDSLGSLLKIREPEWLVQAAFSMLPELTVTEGLAVKYGELTRTTREGLEPMLGLEPGLHKLPRQMGGLPKGSDCLVLALEKQDQPGSMAVFAGSRMEFSRQDADLLKIFVMELGSLLDNARLYSQLHGILAQLKESQAQLIQSSKMAAIGQLAAGVAHELNTPLGAISVAIDGALMALETKPDRARLRLEKAIVSIEQMQQIISKLLFYSRDARTGRRESDINQVISDSCQLVGHQLKMDNIHVELQFNPLPSLLVNPNELQQVFTNLLLNAKDAMLMPQARGRNIVIHTGLQGDQVVVRIRDQGAGMLESVRARIFDPFYTTKPVGHGTGLGLSTSLQLIQQHGGQIEVDSAPGEGTTFSVWLPLQVSPVGE